MNFKEILQKNFIICYFHKNLKFFKNFIKNKYLKKFGAEIFIRKIFKYKHINSTITHEQ